jgi:hypothetical protein
MQAAIPAIVVIRTLEPPTADDRKNRMNSSGDLKKTIRFNKLLGVWAAEKSGITGGDAEACSDAFAVGALDPERCKIRKDFDAAGRRRGPIGRADPWCHERAPAPSGEPNASDARRCT